jgi:hypothetical protein
VRVTDSPAGRVKGPVILRMSNVRVELTFLRAASVPPGKTVSAANDVSRSPKNIKATTKGTFRK